MKKADKRATFWYTGTAVRMDRYVILVGCRKGSFLQELWTNLRMILRILIKNKIKLEWYVPATKKDKSLKLIGKREDI